MNRRRAPFIRRRGLRYGSLSEPERRATASRSASIRSVHEVTSLLRLCRAIIRVLTPSVSKLSAGFGCARPKGPRGARREFEGGQTLRDRLGLRDADEYRRTMPRLIRQPRSNRATPAFPSPARRRRRDARSRPAARRASAAHGRPRPAGSASLSSQRGVEQRLIVIGTSRLFGLQNADLAALQNLPDVMQRRSRRRKQHRCVAAHR